MLSRSDFTLTAVLAVVLAVVPLADAQQAPERGAASTAVAGASEEEIVDRAVARSEAQIAALADADFEATMRSVIDTVNGDGEVTDSETRVYRRYGILGAIVDELIEEDGRPLSEKEARDERKRKEDFTREVQERLEEGLHPQPEDGRRVQFDSYLMDRYHTELVGEEMVRGHLCWVISMEPRPGKLPERNRMDKALNKASGYIWVSQDDYGVARVQFALRDPIKYLGGLLATVRKTDGVLDLERVAPNVWLLSEFELQLDLRVFFKNIRRVISSEWSDYRRFDASS